MVAGLGGHLAPTLAAEWLPVVPLVNEIRSRADSVSNHHVLQPVRLLGALPCVVPTKPTLGP